MKAWQPEVPAEGGVAIVVQARMGSTRLPGKVLMPVAGRPMLSYLVERLRASQLSDSLVVATSVEGRDDAIAELCRREGVACSRGPEHDVLRRFRDAVRDARAGTIVRVTADCPLIDPGLVDAVIEAFRTPLGGWDFASNMLEPTWPYGMAVEVTSRDTLEQADAEATDPEEREHVMPFIYRRPQRFRIRSITRSPDISQHRWTVDTAEDFELVSRILATLYPRKPRFTLSDVLELVAAHSDWELINRHVVQKAVARRGGGDP